VSTDFLSQARAGDEHAFRALVEPHRRELQVHCYRILGSLHDAEDALQETLFSAWRGLGDFEERSSLRTWLYRIATNRCLNALRARRRRTPPRRTLPVEPPEPTRYGDVPWLEPYPDVLIDDPADDAPAPDAIYDAREAISLAFISALQLLPPRQRAVLVLRDVLGYHAREVATMLEATEQSVTSLLKRARATLREQWDRGADPAPNSEAETAVVAQLVRALEEGDVDGLVVLLTDDVWLRMPPLPMEYQGREVAGRFFSSIAFRAGRQFRAFPTAANRQPALAVYERDPHTDVLHANGLFVLAVAGDQIRAITRFDASAVTRCGFPRIMAE
jgi:RNA polymerase sigma-70 factor (TIGR02960 family)